MEPIIFALSAALLAALVALATFLMLWMGERKAHHAARALAEAELNRFLAYKELVEDERRKQAVQKAMDVVQPLWDQVNS